MLHNTLLQLYKVKTFGVSITNYFIQGIFLSTDSKYKGLLQTGSEMHGCPQYSPAGKTTNMRSLSIQCPSGRIDTNFLTPRQGHPCSEATRAWVCPAPLTVAGGWQPRGNVLAFSTLSNWSTGTSWTRAEGLSLHVFRRCMWLQVRQPTPFTLWLPAHSCTSASCCSDILDILQSRPL